MAAEGPGPGLGLKKGGRWNRLPSDKGDSLIAGNIEALSTARVGTGYLVVHPNQVVGRFGELRPFEAVCAGGDILFLGAPQPANLELKCLAASRANVGGRLRLGGLGVEISFIHYM